MTAGKVRRPKRPNMRRAVILFPSGLTLFNLFFGIFAIITASRGDFRMAGVWVLCGGICDALDGRVARATNAGSQFGEELDSLVDAISFGLAPAMIMYFAVLNHDGWDWVFVFLFAACAVMRLARFNIEQAGTAKTFFQGLPSPAAGCTLASYYWFSQSRFYTYGAIGNLPWQDLLRFLMAALAALMISNVPYPSFPRTGFRSLRAIGATVLVGGSIILLVTKQLEFFFPLTLIYVAWGLIRWVFSGLFERRQPTIPYDLSEGEDDEDDDEEEFEPGTSQVHASRRDARPKRDESPRRARPVEDVASRSARTDDRPPRPERPERADRPQRTDAEIAARREKRDKRDRKEKREPREERAPKPPRPEVLAVASTLPSAQAEPVLPASASISDPMDSAGAGPELGLVTGPAAGGDAPAPRKRKRRRRRGERNRAGSDPLAAQQAGGGDGDAGDFDGDGGGDSGDHDGGSTAAPASRSPHDSPYSPASAAPISEHIMATPVVSTSSSSPAAPVSPAEPARIPTPPAEPNE